MGSSRYSDADYGARVAYRSVTGTPTFKYDHDIKTGKVDARVHDTLRPFGVKIRESRDSAGQEKVPVGVILDTTGSMAQVPLMIQKALPKLMGGFINDKASGKKYLGDNGYPDILIGAVDDYNAMGYFNDHDGTLQVGQFESGMEIDDNLTNLWMTGNGGGTYEESYDMALYFFARHTAHDHFDKRGRKGYLFIIGDEKLYTVVRKDAVKKIIGEDLQADIPIEDIIAEVQERYHVFFIIPNMTSHYADPQLQKFWVRLLGQQNVLRLEDPNAICECIVGAVAICESNIGVDELAADSVAVGGLTKALAPLAAAGSSAGSVVKGVDLPTLPDVGPAGSRRRKRL